ncbi:MAG TPA: prenyltransferase/squalene oxidase repeat-containing protein [Opitutus sp.]|nr:prenyltransferase/squalene oxidase repeat-containing protein [Opitutus sp.]
MSDTVPPAGSTRRELLKGLAAAGIVGLLPRSLAQTAGASDAAGGQRRVLDYLESLARPDHGYAFADQQRSHLTPTFAAIACYRILGAEIPRRDRLIEFVRTHHPRELKKLEQERRIFEYQQIQALAWLGADLGEFRERIGAIVVPQNYYRQYERHGHPIFQSETGLVQCHALLGLPLERLAPAFTDYVRTRRRANGSYNNTPAAEGGDGHAMNTLWGLRAAQLLGGADELRAETTAWLQACQRSGGGFTYQPQPAFAGVEDVAYARAATVALRLLGAAPKNRDACVAWVLSLATADGGFSDRPGWQSNPLATYCALETLEALGALDVLESLRRPAARKRVALPPDLKIFSAQLEAHGTGSPAEAVALAAALKIDLWGAKNAKPGWIERAQAIARARGAPVQFFVANEEYGTWVDVPGLGTYSHTSDLFAPADADFGQPVKRPEATSWREYRDTRIAEVMRARGRFFWQFGENEEFVRLLLDDSVARGGFAAISTFHFGNPDFTNTEPFLHRWRGQIPWVALQDAHGSEPWWWSDMTAGYRTLFLGREPTWDAWLEALERNWTVAVRHDPVSRDETWMHAGSDDVLEFVRAHENAWRWWGESPAVRRPLASLVVLRPEDEFEQGRPDRGIALRLRCAWQLTQPAPHRELATFESLVVDGQEREPVLVEDRQPRAPNGADRYRLLTLGEVGVGPHSATAIVRNVKTGKREQITVAF